MADKAKADILPIGPLMIEHRLIERVIFLIEREASRIRASKRPDPAFMNAVIDFFKFYADRGHHGKEEDILFAELMKRDISPADKLMIESLKNDHAKGRVLVAKLEADANEGSVAREMEDLVELYKEHIRKEDKEFFIPAMKYLTKQEQSAMLRGFWEFDRLLIHEKYRKTVEQLENN